MGARRRCRSARRKRRRCATSLSSVSARGQTADEESRHMRRHERLSGAGGCDRRPADRLSLRIPRHEAERARRFSADGLSKMSCCGASRLTAGRFTMRAGRLEQHLCQLDYIWLSPALAAANWVKAPTLSEPASAVPYGVSPAGSGCRALSARRLGPTEGLRSLPHRHLTGSNIVKACIEIK